MYEHYGDVAQMVERSLNNTCFIKNKIGKC